ncbi:hypothetical protein HDU98_010876 [Podochytrium sp. JEL0797]|nr:hypothetical protein HDU98_010876 [Podochytrium sp. JEL0797]
MATSNTQITCQESIPSTSPQSLLFPPAERMDVEIMGTWFDIESSARIPALIYLDELNGFVCKTVELGFDCYPIIVGRKRAVLNRVTDDSGGANIYLPNGLVKCVDVVVPGSGGSSSPTRRIPGATATSSPAVQNSGKPNLIYITGPEQVVDVAIAKLKHLILTKKQSLIHKQIRLIRRKIDWLITSHRDKVHKIMYDNGVHLELPPLGSTLSTVDVIGDNVVYIERAIRALMELVCDFYMANLQIDPSTPNTALALTKQSLPAISQSARCEIITSNQGLEIYGPKFAVKTAVRMICEVASLSPYIREVTFHLELPLEHKEFINGKKSGKINKITKSCGCAVTFHEDLNEYNMVIDVSSSAGGVAMEGLQLLEEELPAEMSFFIPESYHKRIIGVGGKNIQRIMKKFGVYVKFSNAEEFSLLGGYHENRDNVIARTPAKNAENLQLLKDSVFEVVGFVSDVTGTVSIPRVLHRSVKGVQGLVVSGIERGFGVKVVWPDKESGSDEVRVVGGEREVGLVKVELMNLVPDVHTFSLPSTPLAVSTLASDDFRLHFLPRLSQDLTAELHLHLTPSEITFIVYTRPRGNPHWDLVQHRVWEYLSRHGVSIQSALPEQKRKSESGSSPSKSYDSFHHFNSALLSSTTSDEKNQPALSSSPTSFSQQQGGQQDMFGAGIFGHTEFQAPSGDAFVRGQQQQQQGAGEEMLDQFAGLNVSRNRSSGGGGGVKLSIGESEGDNENVTFGPSTIYQLLYPPAPSSTSDFNPLHLLLQSLDLSSHIYAFEAHHIDFNTLLTLSEQQLAQHGVTAFGARKRLVNAIRRVNAEKLQRQSNQQFGTGIGGGGGSGRREMGQQQGQHQPPVGQSPFIFDMQQEEDQRIQQQHRQQPFQSYQQQQQYPSMQNASMLQQQQPPHTPLQGGLLTPSATLFDFSMVQGQSQQQQSRRTPSPILQQMMMPQGMMGYGSQQQQQQQGQFRQQQQQIYQSPFAPLGGSVGQQLPSPEVGPSTPVGQGRGGFMSPSNFQQQQQQKPQDRKG